MARIVDQTGALPGGRRARDLSTGLINGRVDSYFALAFATDPNHDGNFQPSWDLAITPGVTDQLKQDKATRKLLEIDVESILTCGNGNIDGGKASSLPPEKPEERNGEGEEQEEKNGEGDEPDREKRGG